MKYHRIFALLGAVATALSPSGAFARAETKAAPITVNAENPAMRHWTSRVSQSLNDNLVYPNTLGRDEGLEGAVRVAFHCSADGTPAGVSIVQSSRSRPLDQAATYAVQHISTLHPLPDGVGHDRTMEAWVFFASDQQTIDRMKRKFENRAREIAQQRRASLQQDAALAPLVIASR